MGPVTAEQHDDGVDVTVELLLDTEARARVEVAREEVAQGRYLDEAAVRALIARQVEG